MCPIQPAVKAWSGGEDVKDNAMIGMRVALLVQGTRGDVQPYIALALQLQREGCIVNILSNVNHRKFVESQGLDFTDVYRDSVDLFSTEEMSAAMRDGDTLQFFSIAGKLAMESFPDEFRRAWAGLNNFRPQMVLFSLGALTVADLYCRMHKIPAIPAFFGIYTYTGEVAPLGLPTTFEFANKLLWRVVIKAFLDIFEDQVKVALSLLAQDGLMNMVAPVIPSTFEELRQCFNEPIAPKLIGCSDLVLPPLADVPSTNIHTTGWWIVDQTHQVERFKAGDPNFGGTELERIETFLQAGSAPVYLGWGSMIAVSPEFMTQLAVSSLRKTNQRGIILRGWNKLRAELLGDDDLKAYAKDNVLFIESAPHEWLLPQCSMCVSHGGSGTTAASLRTGKPTIITPVFLDQYDFARAVNRLGVGIGTCQFKDVTTDVLGAAITKCLTSKDIQRKAAELGEKLRAEDGCGRAIQLLKEFIAGPLRSGKWLKMEQARQRAWLKERRGGWLGAFAGCTGANKCMADEEEMRVGPLARKSGA
jgi:sterol 3beta-glucosyltransferase